METVRALFVVVMLYCYPYSLGILIEWKLFPCLEVYKEKGANPYSLENSSK